MYEEFSVMVGEAFRKSVDDFLKNGLLISNGDESYRSGYLMGLHRLFTIMEQSADVYDIPLEAIGLNGLTEEDFVSRA